MSTSPAGPRGRLAPARGPEAEDAQTRAVVEPSTVKSHVASLLAKLGLRDRVQAVVFAYENGLIRPGAH